MVARDPQPTMAAELILPALAIELEVVNDGKWARTMMRSRFVKGRGLGREGGALDSRNAETFRKNVASLCLPAPPRHLRRLHRTAI
jgi:hypothetical protein